ncbi:hypothetical protein Golob_026223 [Gossypium lobatum]|uniref:RNase H type-1 domain-containing protein n=1 Tax=Gossypium lobatum TaxID=34289 RepID=A0A7J8LUQ5_9ROSI|nr:hypothetical protein [Gossypium lobatum]
MANNRNNLMFSGKEKAAWVIWERAKSISKDFCFHNMINRPILPAQMVEKWEKPPIDKVKVNFDAAISNDKIGFSLLARDDKGIIVDRQYNQIRSSFMDPRLTIAEINFRNWKKNMPFGTGKDV